MVWGRLRRSRQQDKGERGWWGSRRGLLVLLRAPGTSSYAARRRFRCAWRRPHFGSTSPTPSRDNFCSPPDCRLPDAQICEMSDIPVRPPPPAPPLPPGWTEHKAPSGSYRSACVICLTHASQDIPTTTTRKLKSRRIRALWPKCAHFTSHRRTLRPQVTVPVMTRKRHKLPCSPNPRSTTSYSQARQNSFPAMAERSSQEVGRVECAEDMATSTTDDESVTTGPSTAKISPIARRGCW